MFYLDEMIILMHTSSYCDMLSGKHQIIVSIMVYLHTLCDGFGLCLKSSGTMVSCKIIWAIWNIQGPHLLTWFNFALIPAWISNHILYKVWDEIIYPFLNFNGATIEV